MISWVVKMRFDFDIFTRSVSLQPIYHLNRSLYNRYWLYNNCFVECLGEFHELASYQVLASPWKFLVVISINCQYFSSHKARHGSYGRSQIPSGSCRLSHCVSKRHSCGAIAQWSEHSCANWEVLGLIPSRTTWIFSFPLSQCQAFFLRLVCWNVLIDVFTQSGSALSWDGKVFERSPVLWEFVFCHSERKWFFRCRLISFFTRQ